MSVSGYRHNALNPAGQGILVGAFGAAIGGGFAVLLVPVMGWYGLVAFTLIGGGAFGFGAWSWAAQIVAESMKPAPVTPKVINTGAVIVESRQGTTTIRTSVLPPGFDRDAAIRLARMVANNPTLTNRAGARVGLTGVQMAEWRQHWVNHKWAVQNSETDARAGYSITAAGVEKMAELARAEE